MNQTLYKLYTQCFPNYPITGEMFAGLLRRGDAHRIYAYHNDLVIGFSLIQGNSILLLCVAEGYRRRGYGSYLLQESEEYIKQQGADEIKLGGFALFQGMPAESPGAIPFFKKRGYSATHETFNMTLALDAFDFESLDIPPMPGDIMLRLAEAKDGRSLLRAVGEVDPSWLPIFKNCTDPILVAMRADQVVGFAILSPKGGRFARSEQEMGSIGCVGVVRAARRQGIGLQMVAFGADWLKSQGCAWAELLYLVLVDWYARIGFSISSRQWMGAKKI